MATNTRVAVMVLVAFLAACTCGSDKGHLGRPNEAPSTAVGTEADTSTSVIPTPAFPVGPFRSVDWAVAVLPPLNCGYQEGSKATASVSQVSSVEPEAGKSLAVVLASCTAGAGSPPVGLYVYDGATGATSAHLAQILIDPALNRQTSSFKLNGSTISTTVSAYSSWEVPSCCPDLEYEVQWTWAGGAYQGVPAAATGTLPLAVTVTPSSPTVKVGDRVTYTVALDNQGAVPITDVQVIPQPTSLPCGGNCTGTEQALVWDGGNPSCAPDEMGVDIVCNVGTLAPSTSTRVPVPMLVKDYLNPLTFTLVVHGVTQFGRSSRLGAASIAVQP